MRESEILAVDEVIVAGRVQIQRENFEVIIVGRMDTVRESEIWATLEVIVVGRVQTVTVEDEWSGDEGGEWR